MSKVSNYIQQTATIISSPPPPHTHLYTCRWLVTHLGGYFIKRKLDPSGGKDVLYRKCLHQVTQRVISPCLQKPEEQFHPSTSHAPSPSLTPSPPFPHSLIHPSYHHLHFLTSSSLTPSHPHTLTPSSLTLTLSPPHPHRPPSLSHSLTLSQG